MIRVLKKIYHRIQREHQRRLDIKKQLSDINMMRALMAGPVWCVDYIKFAEERIEIGGWAIPPDKGHSSATFTINDEEFDEVRYPLDREDIERIFWYLPASKLTGYICAKHLNNGDSFQDEIVSLKYVDRDTGKPFREQHNYYYLNSSEDQLAYPPGDNRRRVQGGANESSFRLEGYSTFVKLGHTLKKNFGRGYEDFNHILDWGCGCGRLTRFFRLYGDKKIFGVDIDANNIQWCQNNLRFGQFEWIPLHPPTRLPPSYFDLLIGISIFSHLKENDQFEWLEELRRIASDGAILLMTVHGDASASRSGESVATIASWKQAGILDLGTNPDLGNSIVDRDYYRNTLHTEKYVRGSWSKYFDIVEIIPGYIGNHQDLVVMQKR